MKEVRKGKENISYIIKDSNVVVQKNEAGVNVKHDGK